jgi:two-component system response regulator AlgR
VRVLIADDEPLARERLRDLLAEQPGIELVAEAGDGREALHACAQHHPDLVLLDIAMPGIDGLETARHLAAFEPRPAVVFCTAYDAHALSAFEAAAIDYLVKPVRPERLAAALERARTFAAGRTNGNGDGSADGATTSEQRRTHLCARLRGSLRLIPVEDVHYLQAEKNTSSSTTRAART